MTFEQYIEILLRELMTGNITEGTCNRMIREKTEVMEARLEELETLEQERQFHNKQGS